MTSTNFILRSGTTDSDIYQEVCVKDIYDIKKREFSDNSIIIDVGTHIGTFSHMMASKNIKRIYAYEADEENYLVALQNLDYFIKINKVLLQNKAIWKSDYNQKVLKFNKYINNRAAGDVINAYCSGMEVCCIGLDDEIKSILNYNNAKKNRLIENGL